MVTIVLKTLLGDVFAKKAFATDDRKSQRRWIERQELRYGACLARTYQAHT